MCVCVGFVGVNNAKIVCHVISISRSVCGGAFLVHCKAKKILIVLLDFGLFELVFFLSLGGRPFSCTLVGYVKLVFGFLLLVRRTVLVWVCVCVS